MTRTNEEIARLLTEYLMGGSYYAEVTSEETMALILAALNEATAARDGDLARLQAQLRERTQFICQCGGTKLPKP